MQVAEVRSSECCGVSTPVESSSETEKCLKMRMLWLLIAHLEGPVELNGTPHTIIYVLWKAAQMRVAESETWWQLVQPPVWSRHPPFFIPRVALQSLPAHVHERRTQNGLFQKLTSPAERHSCRWAKIQILTHPSQALWPRTGYMPFWNLSFLICKTGY